MPAPFRKACGHCVKAKRRCDLAVPRCYRCKVRSLECAYENVPPVPRDPSSEVGSVEETSTRVPTSEEWPKDFTLNQPIMDDRVLTSADLEVDFSLPPFPDYNLDWQDVMENIEDFSVPDLLKATNSPSAGVLAGDIYQERIIYSVKRLKLFPGLFVRQGQTPFIHKNLYDNHLPTAIQDALGVCALYSERNETNQMLVYRIISQKAKGLLDNYAQSPSSTLERLASVQALALLQIIRLFDGDIRLRADAERAQPVFLDWIRQLQERTVQLSGDYRDHLTDMALSPASDPWHEWLFAESMRRTVIIGWSIEGLYCFLKNGWDNTHHEFDKLSFFAQKALWAATSEYQWKSALRKYQSFPTRFHTWTADVADLKPADIEDISMIMMALIKGVDHCSHWAGDDYVEQFGLS